MQIDGEIMNEVIGVINQLKQRLTCLWKSGGLGKAIIAGSMIGTFLVISSYMSSCGCGRNKEIFGNGSPVEEESEGEQDPNTRRLIAERREALDNKTEECDKLEFDFMGRVVGAFGYRIGDVYHGANIKKDDSGVVIVHPPKEKRVSWFDTYVLRLMPYTHQIESIMAGRRDFRGDGEWERAILCRMANYWLLVNMCKMVTSTSAEKGPHNLRMPQEEFHFQGDCVVQQLNNEDIVMTFGWNQIGGIFSFCGLNFKVGIIIESEKLRNKLCGKW